MNKHTPGPWRHEGPDDYWDFNILHPSDSLAVAAVVSNMREMPEIKANADLIAAAPELLTALEQLLGKAYKQNWNDLYPQQLAFAETAIAKARGDL